MSDNINEVRNFGLACHTWAISQDIRKVASNFPKLSRRIHGYASRLQAVSRAILSLHATSSRGLPRSIEEINGEPLKNISYAIQILLNQCYELVKPIYAFYRVLKLCAEGEKYEPYLKIRQRYIVAFDPEVMEYVEKLLSGVEEILSRSSEALIGPNKGASLYEIAIDPDNTSRFCSLETDAHVSWNEICNKDEVTRFKLSANCPGLVFMAVRARTVHIPDMPAADRRTLTCLVFKTNTRGCDKLEPDDYQPAHFMEKISTEHREKRPFSKTDATGQLKGQFVLQIDHGRPKRRELILSKDYISTTKEKTDSTSVNVDLCRRKDVILVAFYPISETRIPDAVGSISFFWKRGSGKTSTITAVLVHFTVADDMKLWVAEITLLSKCNQVLNSSRYMDRRWPRPSPEDHTAQDDSWSIQAVWQ